MFSVAINYLNLWVSIIVMCDLITLNIFISNDQSTSIVAVIKHSTFISDHPILESNANLRTILFVHWLFSIKIELLYFLVGIILTFIINLYFGFRNPNFFISVEQSHLLCQLQLMYLTLSFSLLTFISGYR